MPKKNRWSYLNDFKKDEAGQYTYQGSCYCFAGDENERRRAYGKLWALLVVIAAASVGSGCVSGAGILNTFYVILPYLGEICALFALTWYQFKLLTKGAEVRAYIYEKTQPRMAPAAVIIAFFAIVGFITSLVFSVMSGFRDGVAAAVIYLALKAVTAVAALCYRNAFQKLEWLPLS